MNKRDLWPDFCISPSRIIERQASLLGAKTNSIVIAQVNRKNISDNKFHYTFSLIAPVLDNYSFQLFAYLYDFDYYPIHFILDEKIDKEIKFTETWINVKDREGLLILLGKIFNSKRVAQIINTLLSESEGR